MFSLLLVLLSLALVAALAVATLFYGGAGFTLGRATASAAGLVSTGSQVAAAFTLYYADRNSQVSGADLTPTGLPPAPYLTSALPGWSATCQGSVCFIQKSLGREGGTTCQQLNAKAGFGETTDITVNMMLTSVLFCQAILDGDGTAVDYTFNYRFTPSA